MAKPFVNDIMSSSRILSHGKITALPFSLTSGNPFSIFIIPVPDSDLPVLISCKLYQDDNASVCPFNVKQWTETAISEIPSAAIDLVANNVYWGCGIDVSES